MSRGLLLFLFAAAMALPASAANVADARKVESGSTQVVARVDGREITISELRLEMSRLGLVLHNEESERTALDSLVRRTLLTNEARNQKVHRTPEAMMRMHAAQDQALADYLLAAASQPAEPTPDEIETFIRSNTALFRDRKTYDFLIVELPTRFFDEDRLTPLFDEDVDFSRLKGLLDKAGAPYTETLSTQSAAAFPSAIRETLNKYEVSDNIVLKGEESTRILKITAYRRDSLPEGEWAKTARRALLEQSVIERAEAFLERLSDSANVSYFRESAKPLDLAAKRER